MHLEFHTKMKKVFLNLFKWVVMVSDLDVLWVLLSKRTLMRRVLCGQKQSHHFSSTCLIWSVDDEEVSRTARLLYDEFTQKGIEVLYDDRAGVSAGESSKIVISWVFHIVLSFRKNSCRGQI